MIETDRATLCDPIMWLTQLQVPYPIKEEITDLGPPVWPSLVLLSHEIPLELLALLLLLDDVLGPAAEALSLSASYWKRALSDEDTKMTLVTNLQPNHRWEPSYKSGRSRVTEAMARYTVCGNSAHTLIFGLVQQVWSLPNKLNTANFVLQKFVNLVIWRKWMKYFGYDWNLPTCCWSIATVGIWEILSLAIGGGPVPSIWFSNWVMIASRPARPKA